jgi:site-specific recombinase XerD
VSTLIAQGADIKVLQAIAGHASAVMTLDVCGHLMTERRAGSRRRSALDER